MTIFCQKKNKDTVFLKNELHQKVYIEPDKYSSKYKTIVDFNIDGYWRESYEEQLMQLASDEFDFHHYSFGSFPKVWVSSHFYKGKPYVYYPCDFINYSAIVFTDSTLLQFSGEPPQIEPLLGFKKLNDNIFEVITTQRKIKFHFITINGKKVAILQHDYYEEGQIAGAPIYQCMVEAKSIRNIPMIVNECVDMKQSEFIFDEPNFSIFLEGCQ